MSSGIELTWSGGSHTFVLTIDHLRALQQKCNCGPEWLMRRLLSAQWEPDDVIHTIRFALEGGGLDATAARKMVNTHLEENTRNLKPAALIAGQILMDALFDPENDSAGEQNAAAALK